MGLRTTKGTPYLASIENHFDSESQSASSIVVTYKQLSGSLHPNAAISDRMAPALTEPLSPTNKLSSSAASASPRPTAASSPLQNNNNNNNNHSNNNINDSVESVDENSSIQSNSLHNSSGNKEKTAADVVAIAGAAAAAAAPAAAITTITGAAAAAAAAVATTTTTIAAAKGAFQLAFEQSVGVRKTTSTPVVNGDASSAISSQMGPMCDSKSSQPPPSAINSAPKISQIDAETAAKIITSQLGDFPSDIEEAITAEICLRQNLKSNIEAKTQQQQEEQVKGEECSLSDRNVKPMDKALLKDDESVEPHGKEGNTIATLSGDEHEDDPAKDIKTDDKPKVNIISVQELPPIKTDSTVTASEDDNIEERLKQLDSTDDCPLPISQESGMPATPPRTPSAQTLPQLTPTSSTNAASTISPSPLTPQGTNSATCSSGGGAGGGNQKDFKDNTSEMDEDDLLQVLRFETGTGGDIDLAGFLSDYAMNYEDVNPPNTKENPLKEVLVEIEHQQTMRRKIDFLLRRLRKLQARYMSKQASEEISGLFEWSARTTKNKNSDSDHQQLTFAEEKYHPVSTNTMRNVLKKIENAATNVELVSTTVKKQQQLHSIKSELSPSQTEVIVPTYDDKVTEEIGHVSGLLQAEMREVQSAIDSDATASSSGGESADEMVTYNNQFQEPLAIAKRAAWRYSRDRAAVASRWSWLLSQISDLEFKIRQYTELHQQLRQIKGKVVMINRSESGSSQSTGSSSSVNGYRGVPPSGESVKASGYTMADDIEQGVIDGAHESAQGACRTRAFQRSNFRKRKLFQTANVHTISKKAARPSTIKCGCQWPLHPCALCTGRSDPTAPRDLPDTMMMSQRVALLDPGFHPVLSFPEDIPNSIFFEATCRDPDWQNRVVRSTAKSVMKGALAAQRAAEREEHRGLYATSGRITPCTPQNANAIAVQTTGKRKYTKRNHQDNQSSSSASVGGGHSATPLVANKVGKGLKKYHRYRSPDYNRKNNINNKINNNGHHHQASFHQPHQRNVEQSSPHLAHSSSIYQHSKNNKIRKLSSASAAATLNQSGSHHYNSNSNPNNYHINSQHHSYNNELNFLHCDSLDGAISMNGLMGRAGRSRPTSPSHAGGHHKYERSLERKSRTSYDIDNIVIPYSVAAATRVELLPYKEIPTPKWRIVDYDAEDTKGIDDNNTTNPDGEKKSQSTEENPQLESSNCTETLNDTADFVMKSDIKEETTEETSHNGGMMGEVEEEDEGEEDTSDEAMILRHERALTEERRKFQTFLKFPWSTRSRANRRIDSRAESSGANTPDPASPAPNTPSVAGDQESIPSPFAPSTPLNPLDSVAEPGENASALSNPVPSFITSLSYYSSKRQERRRTVSTKKDKEDQRRSSTPDARELIPPYEPLVFPIPNDLFDSMLRMMPDEYPPPQEDCPKPIAKTATATGAANTTIPTSTATATKAATTTHANGIVGDTATVVAPKNFCDQKFNNNNKNAFLTLNNQKSIEHVTGEDDEDGDELQHQHQHQQQFMSGPVNGGGVTCSYVKQIMGAPAPVHSNPSSTRTKEVQFSPFLCRNNLLGCSDTESVDSEAGDDDPNDPEWKDEPE